MKKVQIQIQRHRFTLNCRDEDKAAMLGVSERLNKQIEHTRKQHGVTDSERAAILTAFIVALDKEKGDNTSGTAIKQRNMDLQKLNDNIKQLLVRTDSSAKT